MKMWMKCNYRSGCQIEVERGDFLQKDQQQIFTAHQAYKTAMGRGSYQRAVMYPPLWAVEDQYVLVNDFGFQRI